MLRSLLMARLKMTVTVLSIVLIMAGFGLALRGTPAASPRHWTDAASAPVMAAPPRSSPSDRFGDPLPKYARARLGSTRFHHGTSLFQALYTPDGKSLVAIEYDAIVRVWDAATGRIIAEIGDVKADSRMSSRYREIALSPDGKALAMIDQPAELSIWDLASGRERRRWHQARDEEYEHPTFSPDGRTVATGVKRFDETTEKSESFIALWDTAAPTEHRRRIPGDWVRLWDLKFSPDGKMLATASRDTEVRDGDKLIGPKKGSTRLWDLASGRERSRFPVEGCDVFSIAFSPDGKLLAVAVTDETVRLYDRTTGQERMPRLGPEPARPLGGDIKAAPSRPMTIGSLAFSPDGRILAGGDARRWDFSLAAIHLWDVAGGHELHRIPAHQQRVASLSFAPDGKALASAGAEPVVRLWDVATGREAFPQSGHRSAIRALVVSPADGTLFTGGNDGTIRHWDPSSGRELDLIARLSGAVEALTVAPDGKSLLIGGPMKTQPPRVSSIRLWSVAEHRELWRLARIERDDFHVDDFHDVAYSPDGKTVTSGGRIWDAISGKVLVTLRHQDRAEGPLHELESHLLYAGWQSGHYGGARWGLGLEYHDGP